MNTKELILQKIEKLPDEYLEEVLGFISSLEKRKNLDKKLEVAVLSESSLRKDWLRPEEEEAWKDL
ncbi:MAG: DUF2281 domain-containing protein [Desulfurobacteriaceae bacterium]